MMMNSICEYYSWYSSYSLYNSRLRIFIFSISISYVMKINTLW
jgi:hypothetical protein